MSKSALWLSESAVAGAVSLAQAIEALEAATAAVSRGEGQNIEKALGAFGDRSSLHALGAVLPAAGYGGYKTWVNTPQGAKALYTLFDAEAGRLLAILEANVLGKLRTAAMTGLGTRWLAAEGADDLALIGSGRQALAQVAAIQAVRPLRRIRVWSPTAERREAFAAELAGQFDAAVQAVDSIEAATDGASIVTLVTRARAPFLHAGMLAPGAHLNAVGAILPANAEFHADVFERADPVVVDDLANVRKSAREFIDYYGAGKGDWSRVRTIGEVVAGGKAERAQGQGVSLFKPVGMGMSDLAVARLAYESCRESGQGLELPLESSATMRYA